jgi:hypothetical protein
VAGRLDFETCGVPVEHTASMPSRYVVLAKFMMLSFRADHVNKVLLSLDNHWLVTAWNISNGKKTCRYRVKDYRLDKEQDASRAHVHL